MEYTDQLKNQINIISKKLFGNEYMPFKNKKNKFTTGWLERELKNLKTKK